MAKVSKTFQKLTFLVHCAVAATIKSPCDNKIEPQIKVFDTNCSLAAQSETQSFPINLILSDQD